MASWFGEDGGLVATSDFTMDCPNCGPATLVYTDGQLQQHGCDYLPPDSLTFEVGPEGFTSWPDGGAVNFGDAL